MPRLKNSILKPKATERKKVFSVRIDPALMEQLEALEQRVEKEAPDMVIDRVDFIEPAIRDAIKIVTTELDARAKAAASE